MVASFELARALICSTPPRISPGTTKGALPELIGTSGELGVVTDDLDEMSRAIKGWKGFDRERIYAHTYARARSVVEAAALLDRVAAAAAA